MMIHHRQEQLFPELLKHIDVHLTCVSEPFYASGRLWELGPQIFLGAMRKGREKTRPDGVLRL